MKIISIDVGLRNLAVCVLEGTSRTDVRIQQWDVIDVLGEKNGVARPRCFQCAKPAMWQHATEERYACTKHCPKARVPTKTSLMKLKVDALIERAKALGMTDLPTRKAEIVQAVYTHEKSIGWDKFSGAASVRHAPVLDLATDIARSLDTRAAWWTGATKVVVENQRDRRMFAVQAMIHMYFCTKGFRVQGVSAVHKLNNVLTLDSTTTYRGRKKTGITHCEMLMPECRRAFFRSHTKKDDLADSFLQGLWFLEH